MEQYAQIYIGYAGFGDLGLMHTKNPQAACVSLYINGKPQFSSWSSNQGTISQQAPRIATIMKRHGVRNYTVNNGCAKTYSLKIKPCEEVSSSEVKTLSDSLDTFLDIQRIEA